VRDYDRCELALVCDADPARVQATGENLGVRWTDDIAEVAAPDVDGVSIATPDHLHTAVTMRILEAGKNVFVEKPLATSVEEAEQLAAAAARSGRIAIVDFQNRWNPAFIGIKESVSKGEIGAGHGGRTTVRFDHRRRVLAQLGREVRPGVVPVPTHDRHRPVDHRAGAGLGVRARQARDPVRPGIDCWDAIQALVQFESPPQRLRTGVND
jgi:predicted dehydrogenase